MSNALVQGKSTTNLNPSGAGFTEDINSTAGALHVYQASLSAGESQQFDRTFGGPLAQYNNATASEAIKTGAGVAYGYIVTTAMSAAATTVYDNTAASGTVLFVIPASTAVGVYQFPVGVKFNTGLYASFAGTGTVNFLYI